MLRAAAAGRADRAEEPGQLKTRLGHRILRTFRGFVLWESNFPQREITDRQDYIFIYIMFFLSVYDVSSIVP